MLCHSSLRVTFRQNDSEWTLEERVSLKNSIRNVVDNFWNTHLLYINTISIIMYYIKCNFLKEYIFSSHFRKRMKKKTKLKHNLKEKNWLFLHLNYFNTHVKKNYFHSKIKLWKTLTVTYSLTSRMIYGYTCVYLEICICHITYITYTWDLCFSLKKIAFLYMQ